MTAGRRRTRRGADVPDRVRRRRSRPRRRAGCRRNGIRPHRRRHHISIYVVVRDAAAVAAIAAAACCCCSLPLLQPAAAAACCCCGAMSCHGDVIVERIQKKTDSYALTVPICSVFDKRLEELQLGFVLAARRVNFCSEAQESDDSKD